MEEAKRRLLAYLGKEISATPVVQAMARVPREQFVPDEYRHMAYDDVPLPIGEGQTISQPYIVALMLQALDLGRTGRVLEVGTGSGYQAALLAELAGEVVTVERIVSLAESARVRLERLGYRKVRVEIAGPEIGWPEGGPYDAIIVAAGAPKLLRSLMGQLAVGGRLIVPVGSSHSQELVKVTRSSEAYSIQNLGGCKFVPLIGHDAWPEQGSQ